MTAATLTPAFVATRHRLSFGGIVASEWIKLRSLRSTWWSFGIWLVGTAGLSLGYALLMRGYSEGLEAMSEAMGGLDYLALGLNLNMWFMLGTVLVPLVAVTAVTSEYASGGIKATLSVAPRRLQVLSAKAVVVSLAVAVVGLVTLAVTWAVTAGVYTSQGVPVGLDATGLKMLAGAVVSVVLVALMCLGLGTALRSTAGAITASLGIIWGLPMVLEFMGGLGEWVVKVQQATPLTLSANLTVPEPPAVAYSVPASLLGLVLWAAVPLLAGAAVLKSRDA
jgi:ABC-2 type transport system permease protein